MKISSRAVLPVFAILFSALLVSAAAHAQRAVPDGGAAVTETVTMTEAENATEVTIEESVSRSAGNFQGLIPPAGSTPKVSYGAPRQEGDDTHPPIRLTPDKSEIIRLEEDAASVIVGNPDHLGILMDDSRLLILVPRQQGATYLTVLNQKGKVIMQRHVIVSVANQNYIRIRRSCGAAGNAACQETSVYYCEGMCHETGILQNNGNTVVPPPVTTRRQASSGTDVIIETPEPASPVTVEGEGEGEGEGEVNEEPTDE